jgi:transposase
VPESLEPDVHGDTDEATTLIRLIVDRYHVSEAHAKRWVSRYYRNRSETTSTEKTP